MPKWKLNLRGIVLKAGNDHIEIEKQLNETEWEHINQRHVLAVGCYVSTGEVVLLKIRYNIPSFTMTAKKASMLFPEAEAHCRKEHALIDLVGEAGYGPRHVTYFGQCDSLMSPMSDFGIGMDVLVMSMILGEKLNDVFLELSEAQQISVWRQLTELLDFIYQNGYAPIMKGMNYFRYDEENDKVYLVDFTFFDTIEPQAGHRITEEEVYILYLLPIYEERYREAKELEISDSQICCSLDIGALKNVVATLKRKDEFWGTDAGVIGYRY